MCNQGVMTMPERSWKDPKNAFDCMTAPDWKGWLKCIRSERASWEKLKVFNTILKKDRDRRYNTYPLQEVYTRKWHTSDGSFDKWKCRLVCMGNLFKRGIDCIEDVWAPTISKQAANIFFFLACQEGKRLVKFDVKTAFLLATSSATWYAFYPTMFKIADLSDKDAENMRNALMNGDDAEREHIRQWLKQKVDPDDPRVLEILKSVYGDPAGNRMFWILFRSILNELGFAQTESEPCFHIRSESGTSTTRSLTHGDDGLVAIDADKAEAFLASIKKKAEVTQGGLSC
eukprot:g7924.t1